MRPPWVATSLSRDDSPDHFDIYFGSGLNLYRQTVIRRGGTGPRCSPTGWTPVNIDHADQNGMAFNPVTRCAQYVVSDGGVHRPTDESNPAQCGGGWAFTGGGRNGFNALQIYQVPGQIIPASRVSGIPFLSEPGHTDLYFGTQDNHLWASRDEGRNWPAPYGNEGSFIQVLRYGISHRNAGSDALGRITWQDIGDAGIYSVHRTSVAWARTECSW